MKSCYLNNNNGFTLIEVMIAIVVLTIGLLGAAAMQLSSVNGNAHASNMTEATNLALDQIENILSWDFNDVRLADNENVNFQRMGILGVIGPGNNTINTVNDVADNSTIFGNYTVYWDGTPRMDTADPTLQIGIDFQIYVVWTENNRLKTVAMNFSKPR